MHETFSFNDKQRTTADPTENFPFFEQIETLTNKKKFQEINRITQKTKTILTIIKIFIRQINKIIIGVSINQIVFTNQIFLNHTHKTNKHDNQDIFSL